MSPRARFLAAAALLAAATALPLRLQLSVPWLPAILAGINAATFLLYGYDKAAAGGRALRVPEGVLHLLAALGGTPGALLGRIVFRHKTRKESFRRSFWLIAALQALLLGAWLWSSARG